MSSAPTRRAPQPPGHCTRPRAPLFARCMTGAKHQFLHGRVEFLAAGGADVGLWWSGPARTSRSALRTHSRIGVLPDRSRYTPTPRSTLCLKGSARYFAIKPENGIGYQPLKLLKQKLTPLSYEPSIISFARAPRSYRLQ